MTTRKTSPPGDEYFAVRIHLPGGVMHLASASEPKVKGAAKLTEVRADWLQDPEKGDTLGWIDWDAVIAISWRWTGS